MHPAFKCDGIEGAFSGPAGRGVRCVVVEEVNGESDKCVVVVDDRDGTLPVPQVNTEVKCEMGYEETGLTYMGSFMVEQVELSGWPRSMTVTCTATSFTNGLKQGRHEPYPDTTLPKIIYKVAGRYGMPVIISPEFAGMPVHHMAQDESDIHFLNRLGKTYGAHVTIKNGQLFFIKYGGTFSGASLERDGAVAEYPINVLRYSAQVKIARPGFGSVVGSHWNTDDAEVKQKVVPGMAQYGINPHSGTNTGTPAPSLPERNPIFKVNGLQADGKSQADAIANARSAQLGMSEGKLEIFLIGDPSIMPGYLLNVKNVREIVDGAWYMKQVQHTIDTSGYETFIEAEFPGPGGAGIGGNAWKTGAGDAQVTP